jgi:sulfur carrier protein ThiS adenylyltransferase
MVREFMDKQEIEQRIKKGLSTKVVGIAGAGGLGSNVAMSLARCGVKHFIMVDCDRIEKSNLNRQYYFLSQIGKEKVKALKENIKNINPNITCSISFQKLQKKSMWKPFSGADVIVEALDNAETKIQFIEEILNHLPDKYIVAASGVAGYGHSDRIKTIHSGNLFIVYDEKAVSSDDDVLLAPKVCLMANWQANIVLEILLGDIK